MRYAEWLALEPVPFVPEVLLHQAEDSYNQGKLDEAQSALATVQNVGADLGWQDNARPAALQQKIDEKKTAMARGGAGGNMEDGRVNRCKLLSGTMRVKRSGHTL